MVSETNPKDAKARLAGPEDAETIGRLLFDFNTEFGELTPSTQELADRIRLLFEIGDTEVLLVGTEADGLAVLRFRHSIWSRGLECYLAELYVAPERRGNGLGRLLLEAAIVTARHRGADYMDLGTSEKDVVARHLYEQLGFTNRERSPDGPISYVYERDL